MNKFFKNIKLTRSGFTLPELLIVMTVIAGLAAVMVVTYPATQKKAKDTQRKSDLKQYQTSIEVYANKMGSYTGLSGGNLVNNCATLGLTGACPDDPKSGAHYSIAVNPTQYVLWTQLERPVDPAKTYFVVCSNGKTAEHSSGSGPACPL